MQHVIQLTRRLYNKGGGVNRSIINRSNDLIKQGYKVSIATFKSYNEKKDTRELKDSGRLHHHVTTLNMYSYYEEKNTREKVTDKQIMYHDIENSEKSDLAFPIFLPEKYFPVNIINKKKKWRENGQLRSIEYYSNNETVKFKELFDKNKAVRKLIIFNAPLNNQRTVMDFAPDGFCFLEKTYEENKMKQSTLYNRSTQQVYSFNNKMELSSHWINEICSDSPDKPILICDKKELFPAFLNTKNDVAKRVGVIHNNHLKYFEDTGLTIHPLYKLLLNNINNIDGVIVLTEKQKQDICKSFKCYNKVRVIPHSVQKPAKKKNESSDITFSLIARLHPIKQIDQAIKAFQAVVKEVPEAILNIYGEGKSEENLRNTIVSLHLENNVCLKGFSKNTDQIYQSSLATIVTSYSEGFSMVILESMTEGTPVISYDINYGPSDMITNMSDGFLIKEDIDVLAEKMIYLLKKPKKAHKMGKKAKKNVLKHFGNDYVFKKWIQFFNVLKS